MALFPPWDGDEPPLPVYAEDTAFVRREDGIWCRRDIRGGLYPVNRNGERCARPKAFEDSGGAYRDQRRPSDVSPHGWWKMRSNAERMQWWADHPGDAPAKEGHHDIVLRTWPCHKASHQRVDESDLSTDDESASAPDLTSESDIELPWVRWA